MTTNKIRLIESNVVMEKRRPHSSAITGTVCRAAVAAIASHAYDLGEDIPICWQTSQLESGRSVTERLGSCPDGLNMEFTVPLPSTFQALSEQFAVYTMTVGLDNVTVQSTPDGPRDVSHGNLHACVSRIGFCTPFVANTPELSTHSPAITGNLSAVPGQTHEQITFNSSVAYDEGTYTVIAHGRVYTNNNRYKFDIARAIQVTVTPALAVDCRPLPGQYKLQVDGGSRLQCVDCPRDTYNINADGQCRTCPDGAECNGGSHLAAQRGYWQERTGDFATFRRCFPEDSCCPEGDCSLPLAQGAPVSEEAALAAGRFDPVPLVVVLNASESEFPGAEAAFEAASDWANSQADDVTGVTSEPSALSDWSSGSVCQDGHRGMLCASCEEGLSMWGHRCQECGGGNNSGLMAAVVLVLLILLLSFAFLIPGHSSRFKMIVDLTQLTFFVLDPWSQMRKVLELTVVSIASLSAVSPCPGEVDPILSVTSPYLVTGGLLGGVVAVWAVWFAVAGVLCEGCWGGSRVSPGAAASGATTEPRGAAAGRTYQAGTAVSQGHARAEAARMSACAALSGDPFERLTSACIRVSLLMFPVVFRVGLSLSACQPVEGTMVLVEDPSVRCDTANHVALQSATVVFSVVLAAAGAWVTVRFLHARLAVLDAFVEHVGAGQEHPVKGAPQPVLHLAPDSDGGWSANVSARTEKEAESKADQPADSANAPHASDPMEPRPNQSHSSHQVRLRPGESAPHLARRIKIALLFPQLSLPSACLQRVRLAEGRSTMSLTSFERTFGHLFLCYREGLDWYYEAVTVLRRVLAGSLAVLLAAHPFQRRAALFACMVIFLVLQATAKPFFRKADNTSGVVVLSVLCCVAGLELSGGDSASGDLGEVPHKAATAVAQVALVALAALWVFFGEALNGYVAAQALGGEVARSSRSDGEHEEGVHSQGGGGALGGSGATSTVAGDGDAAHFVAGSSSVRSHGQSGGGVQIQRRISQYRSRASEQAQSVRDLRAVQMPLDGVTNGVTSALGSAHGDSPI